MTRASTRTPGSLTIVVAVFGLLLAVPTRSSALATPLTFVVNSAADVPDAKPGDGVCETALHNGVCTLRGAIQEANKHGGADTIVLQAVKYTLTRVGTNEDAARNGDLDITHSVTITGAGAGGTIIDYPAFWSFKVKP